jgi:hypothetical protein
MGVSVNTKVFKKRMKNALKVPYQTMADALPVLISNTPGGSSGYARSQTKLSSNKLSIDSDYPYAEALDSGSSKQAPNGFTKPTIQQLPRIVDKHIKRV